MSRRKKEFLLAVLVIAVVCGILATMDGPRGLPVPSTEEYPPDLILVPSRVAPQGKVFATHSLRAGRSQWWVTWEDGSMEPFQVLPDKFWTANEESDAQENGKSTPKSSTEEGTQR